MLYSETVFLKEKKIPPPFFSWKNFFLFFLFFLAVVFWWGQRFFIAATVNGQPISRWQLSRELHKKFGSQVLDSLIDERLLLSAFREKGIFVKGEEIEEKIKFLEKQLSAQMPFEEALRLQGLTRNDLERQLEINLSIEKMFAEKASVSGEEVEEYLRKNNWDKKKVTEAGKLREEAEKILRQQKINDLFEEWFGQIRQNAQVKKFL